MLLRHALDECSMALLLRIAEHHHLALPDLPARAEVSAAVEALFNQPDYLQAYLTNLPPLSRRLLEFVAGAGGEVRGYELERRVRQWVSASPPIRDVLLDLLQRGLLFRTFAPAGPNRGEVYYLPAEMHPLLVAGSSMPSLADLLDGSEPAGPILECDPAFDLFVVASSLRSQSGGRQSAVGGQSEPVLGPELNALTPASHWRFLVEIGSQAGAFRKSRASAVPVDHFASLLERNEALVRRLWQGYVACHAWSEVVESGLSPSPLLGRLRDPAELREQMRDLLRALRPGAWYVVESVIAAIQHLHPDILREHFESTSASLLDPASGQLLHGPESWMQVEARVLRYLLSGPLYWLGILRWAVDASGRHVVALGDWGAALALDAWPALVAPPEPAHLERNGTLHFPRRGNLAAMYELESYVRPLQPGETREYFLDAESVCDGLAAGGSLEDVMRFLSAVLGAPLSERVKQTLSAWAAEYGQVSLRPAMVLSARDPDLGARLLDDPELAPYLRARLGPNTAQVGISQIGPLVRQLRSMGHYPAVDAALRLVAGRGAYAALVDEHALELLLVSLETLRRLAPSTLADLEHLPEFRQRLQAALGPERSRRLKALAQKMVKEARLNETRA